MSTGIRITVCVFIFLTGYAVAVIRHDVDGHTWQIGWLIGERGIHARVLRQVCSILGIPGPETLPDPTPPSLWRQLTWQARDAARTVRSWLRHTPATDVVDVEVLPEPEQPEPEPEPVAPAPAPAPAPGPKTEPASRAIDTWQANNMPAEPEPEPEPPAPDPVDQALARFTYAEGHQR